MNVTPDQFFSGAAQPQTQTPQQPTAPTNPNALTPQQFFSGAATPTSTAPQQAPSVGGFIGNAIGSTASLVGGAVSGVANAFNPNPEQNTLVNLGRAVTGVGEQALNTVTGTNFQGENVQKAQGIENFYNQRYGISDLASGNVQSAAQKILSTLYSDPAGAAADLSVLLGGAGAVAGKVGELGQAGAAADAVKAGDALAMGGRTAEGAAVATPQVATTAGNIGETLSKAGEAVNPFNVITKPVQAIANSNFLGDTAKGAASQLTGIQPNDISTITKFPEEFTASNVENYNRATNADTIEKALTDRVNSLKETGAGYSDIKASTAPIPVQADYLKNLIEDKTGLSIGGDGTATYPYEVKLTGDSTLAPSDANKLQKNILDKWSPEFAKGYLTPKQFLNLRHDLGTMAHYEGIGKSKELDNLASIMRGTLNSDFREKIPGLAETDAKFVTQAKNLDEVRHGILNKDNTLNPHAVNRIANALGKGKDDFLTQLEDISPGITKKIAVGKAMENIQALKGNVVGTYGRAAGTISAAAAGLSGGPLGSVAAAIAEHILTSPAVAVPILKAIGKGTPLYQAILDHFNVTTPAQIAAQVGRLNKAAQTPPPKSIKVTMSK